MEAGDDIHEDDDGGANTTYQLESLLTVTQKGYLREGRR